MSLLPGAAAYPLNRTDRSRRSVVHALLVASIFGMLAWGGIALTKDAGRIAALWLPNAMLLAVLLGPVRSDPRLLLPACYVANVIAARAFGDPWSAAFGLGACNMAEIAITVAMMRWLGTPRPDVTRPRDLVSLAFSGSLVAPSISATLASIVLGAETPGLGSQLWQAWFVADALGMLIAAPVALVLLEAYHSRSWREASRAEAIVILSIVTLACILPFLQSSYPLLFVIAPVIVLAAFRLGAPGAAISIVIVAVVSIAATASGMGPLMMIEDGIQNRLTILQLFLATSFLTSLPVAAAVAEQRRVTARLRDSEALRSSITDNMREVVFSADRTGHWTFLNPHWVHLTGQPIEQSLGRAVDELIAEDDRGTTSAAFLELMTGTRGELETSFRFRHADGRIRWAETLIRRHMAADGSVLGTIGSIRDITERVEQASALAARERELRLLADNSNDMIVRIGLDGIRRYISPACRKLLGYEPEELIGVTPVGAIHSDDRARVERVCRGLLDGSSDPICTYRQRRKDGSYAQLEAAYQLVRDEDGRPVEFVATVRDIAQRHDAERRAAAAGAQLEESHRLLVMAGAIAQVGYWRIDVIANEGTLSDGAAQILALPPGTLPMPEDGAKGYHVDDRAVVREALAQARLGKPFFYQARVPLPDGGIRFVEAQGQPEFAPDGTVVGIFGVVQDVSERVAAQAALTASEERHRLLSENATDVVLRTGVPGDVTYISPSCFDLSGYTPDELVGRPAADFIHPDDLERVRAAHIAIVSGASAAITIEYRLRHKGGGWRWLESHIKGWRGPEGASGGAISAIRDIGTRKAMEAELVAARDAAQAAARVKAEFLANMSHEIRTPMNGVIGFTELLLQMRLDDQARDYARMIDESGRAMMTLLNDILDLSKIEAGRIALVEEQFNLSEAVDFCVRLVRVDADRKGLLVETAIALELGMVTGDRHRLQQILLNLMSNAVKFTETGFVRLRAERGVAHDDVRLIVEDSGCGIPADRRDAIFHAFEQADASVSRRYGGTGLGLAISRRLALLMGGTLSLDDSVDTGTRMVVCLPLGKSQESAATPHVAKDEPAPGVWRARILVADDVEINRALAEAILTRHGHDVLLAVDGADVLSRFVDEEAGGRQVDLILMDLQMPRIDGLEAARRIRATGARGRSVPIIALTANALTVDQAACGDASIAEVLTKPINQAKLLRTIETQLGASEAPHAIIDHAAADPKIEMLRDRYRAFRGQVLHEIETALSDPPTSDARALLAGLCHKLAGSAGMFGENQLGELARTVEEQALSDPTLERATATARLLATELRRAA